MSRFLLLACLVAVPAAAAAPTLGPKVFPYEAMQAERNAVGEVRHLVDAPTATLDELEMHVTTLNPGVASHPPHRHANEELVIIDKGEVETLSEGKWVRCSAGCVIFNAANSLHALRNVGTTPAQYHVVNWKTAKTK